MGLRWARYSFTGALTSISGHGSNSEFYYHTNGLLAEKATFVDGDKFSTLYTYDVFERLSREVRPNGQYDPVNDAPVHLHDAFDADKYVEPEYMYDDEGHIIGLAPRDYTVTLSPKRLAIDYVYNRNGYLEKFKALIPMRMLLLRAQVTVRKFKNLSQKHSSYLGNTVTWRIVTISNQVFLAINTMSIWLYSRIGLNGTRTRLSYCFLIIKSGVMNMAIVTFDQLIKMGNTAWRSNYSDRSERVW